MLEDNEFEVKVVPCIIQLFESNDRAIRLMLLNTIELYASMFIICLKYKTIYM